MNRMMQSEIKALTDTALLDVFRFYKRIEKPDTFQANMQKQLEKEVVRRERKQGVRLCHWQD